MTVPVGTVLWTACDGLPVFDRRFAETLGTVGDETRPEVLLAAALTSRLSREGHVCLDPHRLSVSVLVALGLEQPFAERLALQSESWSELLAMSPLADHPAGMAPLALDARGRIYLRKMWDAQEILALGLVALATGDPAPVAVDAVDAVPVAVDAVDAVDGALERDFSQQSPGALLQKNAIRRAVDNRLTVITGGPGTGKTSVIVRILAILAEQARTDGAPPLKVSLLAPTGKAALRLTESIRLAKQAGGGAPDDHRQLLSEIPEQAQTIHRALGLTDGPASRSKRSRGRGLDADVVIIDEASMVDLQLMKRVVEAVPPHARLVILGDRVQLASVDAGAVLGDLCDGLPDSVVELRHSYRFDSASGIGNLAEAIRGGDSDRALSTLGDERFGDVGLVPPGPGGNIFGPVEKHVIGHVAPMMTESLPSDRLRALGQSCILTARRTGRVGATGINRLVESMLHERGLVPAADWYDGRPVMLGKNDYELGLYNGDLGVAAPGDDGEIRVHFERAARSDGLMSTVDVAPAMLPICTTAFSMTIHKSQGSEFDHVLVVLPDELSPLLSRELLYTAVTRARRSVTVLGRPEILAAAINTPTVRHSGLADSLRRGLSV